MRRWLTNTFTLIMILSMLSGFAVWLGYQQQPPNLIALLHLDRCKPPCWIGIIPGKTTWPEARVLIDQIYPIEQGFEITVEGGMWSDNGSAGDLQKVYIENVFKRVSFAVQFVSETDNAGNKPIRTLEFLFSEQKPQLAELHSILGRPFTIAFDSMVAQSYMDINDSRFIEMGYFEGSRVVFEHSIAGLAFANAPFPEGIRSPEWKVNRWQGFASLDKYRR